jgi:Mg-chelatase subunit ChlD
MAPAAAVAVGQTAPSGRIEPAQLESAQSPAPVLLGPGDRWRLVLARRENECSGAARRYGIALDELYGHGGGRSGRRGGSASSGGGREAAFPNVREWAKELEALFGKGIREEVLSAAVASGHLDAALLLDPATVTPSVELLRNVLSMAGNLPENSLAQLRPLVKRLVDELTRQLANRLRPALHGLTSPRPSSRPSNRLDFDRTVRANLATARREPDGRVTLLPERPVFRSRVRKSAEWDLILVVDVSGSMESSVIWSALTASVFAGISTLRTHFLAFSTEVVDFTDRVSDPLSLLLEVRVGGGTHIAAGLAHARSLMTVPSRTLIVTISDFEEGYPVGGLLAEVRKLAESGATLLGCASLDDEGAPRYSVPIAQAVVAAGMPVAALSPLELAAWVGEKIR